MYLDLKDMNQTIEKFKDYEEENKLLQEDFMNLFKEDVSLVMLHIEHLDNFNEIANIIDQ